MDYISKYSNGKNVSAAQYITEIICEHKAKIEKKDLHFRFWQTSNYWSKFYRNQISSANKLLQKYCAKSIIMALNDPKAQKIFSLRAPHLEPIIEYHQELIDSENQKDFKQIDRVDHTKIKPQKNYKKNNILDKLDQ